MNTVFSASRYMPFKRIASILLLCLLVAFYFSPGIASAHTGTIQVQFSTQARIGFQSGDDWEPAITTDRYGHVYALYKHFNVQGGQTCDGCRNHLLFQRSDNGCALSLKSFFSFVATICCSSVPIMEGKRGATRAPSHLGHIRVKVGRTTHRLWLIR